MALAMPAAAPLMLRLIREQGKLPPPTHTHNLLHVGLPSKSHTHTHTLTSAPVRWQPYLVQSRAHDRHQEPVVDITHQLLLNQGVGHLQWGESPPEAVLGLTTQALRPPPPGACRASQCWNRPGLWAPPRPRVVLGQQPPTAPPSSAPCQDLPPRPTPGTPAPLPAPAAPNAKAQGQSPSAPGRPHSQEQHTHLDDSIAELQRVHEEDQGGDPDPVLAPQEVPIIPPNLQLAGQGGV